jgi:signal peptide peptidase SppA
MTISTRVRYEPRGLLALEPTAYGASFEPADIPQSFVGQVAVMAIRGPLMQHADECFASYDVILSTAANALAGKPKALVLSIASPGGLVAGCFECAETLRNMAAAADVPLIAYVDGQASSAAYALACAASQIFAPATADVGSIGVIGIMADATKQVESAGMRFAVVTSGARKADGNPLTALTPEAIAAKQANVDEMAEMFFAHVSKARGISPAAVRALEAASFTGASALRLHLVDAVQNLDQLLASLNQSASAVPASAAKENPMSVKATLQAVIDDEKASDEDKEDAKKALAALGGDEEDDKAEGDDDDKTKDDSAESEEDDEEPKPKDDKAAAPAAVSAIAPTAETRLAALEATIAQGADNGARRKLFAARPDLSKEQIKALKAVPTSALAAALGAIPAPKAKVGLTVAAVAGVQTAPSATPAAAGAKYDDKRAAQRKRMGLAASSEVTPIRIEDNRFVFSVDALAQSKAQAKAGGKVTAQ